MRRTLILLPLLLLLLTACRRTASTPLPAVVAASARPTAFVGTPVPRTCAPGTRASRTPTPRAAQDFSTPAPRFNFEVRLHPDGGLYVGDQVSFEVIPPPEVEIADAALKVAPEGAESPITGRFRPYGIAGRMQATLYWVWDTAALEAGAHPITFSVQPLGYTWTYTVTLGAPAALPPPEPEAHWATRATDCCTFHYISGSAAACEITATLRLADSLAEHAAESLGTTFSAPMTVTLMPRVLGQGGFAADEMYISFLDRNYAGSNFDMVLHHEMVHVLDARLGGEMRPSILVEGLAVYLTGGHYKPEAILPRAAALLAPSERADHLGLGWYLPLWELADDFYAAQHEIGYIEAGALVQYLVETQGWEAFSAFYRDIHPVGDGGQAGALDAALRVHFGMSLNELEDDFLASLRAQPLDAVTVDDVRLTVAFFDVMRRYQQVFDPSAYFRTAWLPDGATMRRRGIVADLVRHPAAPENLALETLLVSADAALERGDPAAAETRLAAVTATLDAVESGASDPFAAHPLAQAHLSVVRQAAALGFQVEQIEVTGETATAIWRGRDGRLQTMTFTLE